MNKAFTLLELVVVIIILGVLATLGLTQYGRMVERTRQAEAKTILGDIRKLAIAYRLENGTIAGFSYTNANIGTASDQLPLQGNCRSTHWFSYNTDYDYSEQKFWACAYRCTSGGKPHKPQAGRTTFA